MAKRKAGSGPGRGTATARRPAARPAPDHALPWRWVVPVVVATVIVLVLIVRAVTGGSTAGAFVGGDLHSLVVDPTDPSHLLVGGHQSAASSRDGGRTFHQIADLANADAMSWSVALDGRHQVVSGHYGLRVSSDGGATWTDRTGSEPDTDTHAVGLDPSAPGHLVAYVVGRGVFTSGDDGQSWQMAGGETLSLMGPILVSQGARTLVAADMSQGIVRSSDGGHSWAVAAPGIMATWLAADPRDAQHLLATGAAIMESHDGGTTWNPVAGRPPQASAVAIAPGNATTWYAASLSGTEAVVSVSHDSGRTWTAVTSGS